MHHFIFSTIVSVILIAILYAILHFFIKPNEKTEKIFVFVLIISCILVKDSMPEKFFLKFKNMDSALMYSSYSKPDYVYREKDWGFAIFNADSNAILKSVNKKDGKWIIPNKKYLGVRETTNHVGSFRILEECNLDDTDCLIVIFALYDKAADNNIMTDSLGNTLEHVIINNNYHFYFIRIMDNVQNYIIDYNNGKVFIK